MAPADRILLVEGEADQSFFREVLKASELIVEVKVAPPKEIGGSHNTKEGVFNHLPVLLNQLADGQLKHLAVVVDADSEVNGGGAQRAIDRVNGIVAPYGFELVAESGTATGIVFKHHDGLADFGLWVMPDNAASGMLEDWIKRCVHPDEQTLLAHAASVVADLPKPVKFKPIHCSKAEVATWLAWQKKPGHGLYGAIVDQLLDPDSASYQSLMGWLRQLYAPAPT